MCVCICRCSCTIYMYSPHSIIYISAVIHTHTYTNLYTYAVTAVIQALETLKQNSMSRECSRLYKITNTLRASLHPDRTKPKGCN